MRRYQIIYFFREGVRGVFLHGFMSFAAISIIAACLLIMGSFALVSVNVNRVIEDLRGQNEILVFINEDCSEAEAKSVGTRINQLDNIASCVFISKEEAFEDYKASLGEYESVFDDVENNPLRYRFRIMLFDVAGMSKAIGEIEKMAGVSHVRAEIEISDFILSLRSVVSAISITLVIMLLFVSVFIISNTVKLATFDRREEIAIMKVVGATNGFIRWPFVVEGFLLGITGAFLGFFLQWAVYNYMDAVIADIFPIFMLLPFSDLLSPVLALFTGFGFIVGVLGSVLTIRRFLRV